MTTIISGSPSIQSFTILTDFLATLPFRPTTVFSDMRSGPGIFGYRWAKENKIPLRTFNPEWDRLGKPAGLICCFEMAAYSQALIAITDGTDHVTEYQIRIAKQCTCELYVKRIERQQQTLADFGRSQN